MNRQYVIINNRAYDVITGLPRDDTRENPIDNLLTTSNNTSSDRGVNVGLIHNKSVQPSKTLSRRYTPRPSYMAKSLSATESPVTQQFAQINRFPTHQTIANSSASIRADRPAQTHPMIERTKNKQIDFSSPRNKRIKQQQLSMQNSQQPGLISANSPKPARQIKEDAIHRVLQQNITSADSNSNRTNKGFSFGWSKILPAGLAVMLLGGYLTYLSIPNISIKVASARTGINAKYPNYQPNGYSLSGPIALSDDSISMKFAYASGNESYTIKQQKSSWDSSAVKQFINSKNQNATITQANGLTIYSYDSNAVWVNGGVLYTLEGNAPLSNNQIQRIATSM